jgi:cytoskeleton protein RodZ
MQTIGAQLEQARESRRLSLADAAQATAIRRYFLQALEGDDFDALPSRVHARGFLRNYAVYLGLDPAPLLEALRTLTPPPDVLEKVEEPGEAGITVEGPEGEDVPAALSEAAGAASTTEASAATPTAAGSTAALDEGAPEKASPAPEPGELETPALPQQDDEQLGIDEWDEPDDEPARTHTGRLSSSIFLEIGDQLRQRRELLGLNLDEVERHTRIPQHHLVRLEAGQFDRLPAAVQARGMLTAYARFLDLDPDILLLRYADALLAQRDERHPRPARRAGLPQSVALPASIRSLLSTDLVVGGGLILALGIFAVWGAARVLSIRAQESQAAPGESVSQVLLDTPGPDLTPSPEAVATGTEVAFLLPVPSGPSETPTAFPTRFSTAPVQLIVAALGRTWMRITVDGKIAFEDRTTTGGAYSFEGSKQIEMLVADGSAVSLIYNRELLGAPGGIGEVVDLIYTPGSVLLPTPTITPSPTITPRPTSTPRPSPTPRISPTPRSTAPIG